MKHSVAMVGSFNPPSEQDWMRLLHSMELGLRRVKPEELDLINLLYKRDFLKEDRAYEAVILHSVFHTDIVSRISPVLADVSPVHSRERWNKRLKGTEAKMIFVWDQLPFSLGGWHIGAIDGYEIIKKTKVVTVYDKKEETK